MKKNTQKNIFLLAFLILQSHTIFSMKRKITLMDQEEQIDIGKRKKKNTAVITLDKEHPLINQSSFLQNTLLNFTIPEEEDFFSIYEENTSVYNGLVLLIDIIDSNINTVDDFVGLFSDNEILDILLALSKYDIKKLDENQNNIYFEMIMPQLVSFYAHHTTDKFYNGENVLESFFSPISLVYQLNNLSFTQSFRKHMDEILFNKNIFTSNLWKWVIEQIENNSISKNIASKIASIPFTKLIEIDPVHFNYTNKTLDFSNIPFFIDFSQENEYNPLYVIIKLNSKQTILSDLTLNSLFSHITSLQSLNLENNNIAYLPESIVMLKNLEVLHLKNNSIIRLPESIGNIHTLKRLFLDNNQLERLPESISNLTNLKILTVSNNALTSLPEFIDNITNLIGLHLGSNELLSLPKSFGNLTQLQTLHLENNNLIMLPDSLGNLVKLRELYLNNNQLVFIPESIGNLKGLKKLYLQNNYLEYLPLSIGELTYLQILNLENNHLEYLPESMVDLPMLRTIYLKLNNFPKTYIEDFKIKLKNTKIDF